MSNNEVPNSAEVPEADYLEQHRPAVTDSPEDAQPGHDPATPPAVEGPDEAELAEERADRSGTDDAELFGQLRDPGAEADEADLLDQGRSLPEDEEYPHG